MDPGRPAELVWQPPGNDPGPTIVGVARGVAQLAERYVCKVEAEGSSPFTSTCATPLSFWDS